MDKQIIYSGNNYQEVLIPEGLSKKIQGITIDPFMFIIGDARYPIPYTARQGETGSWVECSHSRIRINKFIHLHPQPGCHLNEMQCADFKATLSNTLYQTFLETRTRAAYELGKDEGFPWGQQTDAYILERGADISTETSIKGQYCNLKITVGIHNDFMPVNYNGYVW